MAVRPLDTRTVRDGVGVALRGMGECGDGRSEHRWFLTNIRPVRPEKRRRRGTGPGQNAPCGERTGVLHWRDTAQTDDRGPEPTQRVAAQGVGFVMLMRSIAQRSPMWAMVPRRFQWPKQRRFPVARCMEARPYARRAGTCAVALGALLLVRGLSPYPGGGPSIAHARASYPDAVSRSSTVTPKRSATRSNSSTEGSW